MKNKGYFNIGLVFVAMILMGIGLTMVFSSSFYYSMSMGNDKLYFLRKNFMWDIIGFIAMLVAYKIPYTWYRKIAPLALISSIFLLVLVLTPAGTEINNSHRWIMIGPISFMPSEFAKPCIIIFMAYSLSVKEKFNTLRTFKKGILPYLIIAGIYAILIYLQPNLSTAIATVLIILSMVFIAGVKLHHWLEVVLAGAVLAFIGAKVSPYRWKRVLTFLNPFEDIYGSGWQVVQSLYALSSGGWRGVGLGRSIQNKLYLPEPQNDFIFATIGEELGFIGSVIVIILFLIFIYMGIKIALNSNDQFGFYLASGIVCMVSIQTLMNIAVATSSMPATGISLPFISFGGNALVFLMLEVGILLNISSNAR